MKPRSTVTALLAITETLLAARAARKAARTKQASTNRTAPQATKVVSFATERRPLVLRIKAIS
jgi:hypothetical protein